MEILIRHGVEELRRSGSVNFNLENVLRESGVSRGSLYHHFGSRHGLISHCEAQLLKESLKFENEMIRQHIESGATSEELFNLLHAFVKILGSNQVKVQRGRRIRTIAASIEDDTLRKMLGESQVRGSKYLTTSYEIARERGLIDPVVDIETLVYVTQAMFLGRVLVDITDRDELSDSVNEAIFMVIKTLMNPQTAH
jgi:AcrR family transcriptional regulator